jgi:hypothetical protein
MKKLLFVYLIILSLCTCVTSNKTQNASIEATNGREVERINSPECLNLQKSSNDRETSAVGGKYFITSSKGLHLRKFAKIDSEITTIPRGSRVELIAIDPDFVLIDGITDHWYFVKYEDITGWVFGGYLVKVNDLHDKFPEAADGVMLESGEKWFTGQDVDDEVIAKSNIVVETSMFGPYFGPLDGFEDGKVKVAWNDQKRILYIEVLRSTVKTYSGLTLGSKRTDVLDTLGIPHFESKHTLRYDNSWDGTWGIIFQFENDIAVKIVLFAYD